jgi:hypothetical protein
MILKPNTISVKNLYEKTEVSENVFFIRNKKLIASNKSDLTSFIF